MKDARLLLAYSSLLSGLSTWSDPADREHSSEGQRCLGQGWRCSLSGWPHRQDQQAGPLDILLNIACIGRMHDVCNCTNPSLVVHHLHYQLVSLTPDHRSMPLH